MKIVGLAPLDLKGIQESIEDGASDYKLTKQMVFVVGTTFFWVCTVQEITLIDFMKLRMVQTVHLSYVKRRVQLRVDVESCNFETDNSQVRCAHG